MQNKNLSFSLFFISLLFCLFSCETRQLDKDQLQIFHTQYISPNAPNAPKTISDTVILAWAISQNLKTAQMAHSLWLEHIIEQIALEPKNRFVQIGSQSLEAFERQMLSLKIDSQRFQVDTAQNLAKWIRQSVQNQRISILITDFRYRTEKEYRAIRITGDTIQTRINPYAWASAELEKFWEKGGKLRLYPLPCAAQQKLYVLVFVPKMPKEQEKRLLEGFLKPENKLNVRLEPQEFALPQLSTLRRNYEKSDQGALNPKIIALQYRQMPDYEYFMVHKNDLKDHYAQKRRLLFSQLFLPLDSLILKKTVLEVKVWDVGKSYQFFLQTLENQPPNTPIDPETGDQRPKTSEVGFRFTGETPAKAIFELSLDSITHEIRLLGKNELLEIEKEGLFLVQIKLKNAPFHPAEPLRKLLRYPDPEGFWQEALYASLRKSLEKCLQNQPDETIFQFYWQQVE